MDSYICKLRHHTLSKSSDIFLIIVCPRLMVSSSSSLPASLNTQWKNITGRYLVTVKLIIYCCATKLSQDTHKTSTIHYASVGVENIDRNLRLSRHVVNMPEKKQIKSYMHRKRKQTLKHLLYFLEHYEHPNTVSPSLTSWLLMIFSEIIEIFAASFAVFPNWNNWRMSFTYND